MHSDIIQEHVDNLCRAMLAKGLKNPIAQVNIEAHVAPFVYLRWDDVMASHGYRSEFIRDPDVSEAINDAFAFVFKMPSLEESKRQQFMELLAKTIDLGRENGIEVDFVNPLVETMKQLSENALTYRPMPAERPDVIVDRAPSTPPDDLDAIPF